MDLVELSQMEQKLLLELYCYEMDSAGQIIGNDELIQVLNICPAELKLSFRKLALKGLLLGQSMTVRGKLFVEESGLLPVHRWSEVQAIREAIAVAIVEAMVTDPNSDSINLNDIVHRLPIKPGIIEFNLDVMAERGFITVQRGNCVGLGPRLRAMVGR